ncbi:unnamed protein product, partial [Ectocarpus sp. 6 AP-2014]
MGAVAREHALQTYVRSVVGRPCRLGRHLRLGKRFAHTCNTFMLVCVCVSPPRDLARQRPDQEQAMNGRATTFTSNGSRDGLPATNDAALCLPGSLVCGRQCTRHVRFL